MISILFVCTGDTCRSTMASAILKEKLRTKNIKSLTCSSAGLFVGKEIAMNDLAKKVLRRMDVRIPRHKATQLTEGIIQKYDYVLTMTDEQAQTILNRFPHFKNVYSIKKFVGGPNISDPYGKGEAEYYNLALYLDRVIDRIVNKIAFGRMVWK